MSILGYFELKHATARKLAAERIGMVPDGSVVVIREPVKSREQEEKYHALIGEIAANPPPDALRMLNGQKLDRECWKRLLIDAFRHETKDDPDLAPHWQKFGSMQLLPALNRPGFVTVGEQSRNFSTKLASAFIGWLQAFAATETEAA